VGREGREYRVWRARLLPDGLGLGGMLSVVRGIMRVFMRFFSLRLGRLVGQGRSILRGRGARSFEVGWIGLVGWGIGLVFIGCGKF
jgi:hypothetical protein